MVLIFLAAVIPGESEADDDDYNHHCDDAPLVFDILEAIYWHETSRSLNNGHWRPQPDHCDSNLNKLKHKPNSTDQLNKPYSQPINERVRSIRPC